MGVNLLTLHQANHRAENLRSKQEEEEEEGMMLRMSPTYFLQGDIEKDEDLLLHPPPPPPISTNAAAATSPTISSSSSTATTTASNSSPSSTNILDPLREATIVFCYSTTFRSIDGFLLAEPLAQALAGRVRKDAIVITTDKRFVQDQEFELLEQREVENPEVGGSSIVYFHRLKQQQQQQQ